LFRRALAIVATRHAAGKAVAPHRKIFQYFRAAAVFLPGISVSVRTNMGIEGIFSALRLELRPGEWVLWDARPHRFESLTNDRTRIRDATTNEVRDVSVATIRGLPILPSSELDARLDRQRTMDPDDWSLARKREEVIREALTGDGSAKKRIRIAAEALGASSRVVYRLVARYRISVQTTSVMPQLRGPNKKRRRLGTTRERLIDEAIERRYLVRPRTRRTRSVVTIGIRMADTTLHNYSMSECCPYASRRFGCSREQRQNISSNPGEPIRLQHR
jgi:hypothetical protein